MRVEIATARLRIRPYRESDLDALHRLWTDPVVRRFLWDDEVIPRETAATAMRESIDLTAERGFGHWALRPPGSDEIVGFCGFRLLDGEGPPELLYGLHPSRHGRGLAVEAARAMLRFGFEERGFADVVAITDVPNTASVRVMERAGLRFLRRGPHHGLDSFVYGLGRADFRPDGAPYRVHEGAHESGQSGLHAGPQEAGGGGRRG